MTARERAVLIARREDPAAPESLTGALQKALDWMTHADYQLVAVMDPADWRQAFRMVADGLVDVIVVGRFDDLPAVRMVPHEAAVGTGRTRLLPRPVPAQREVPRTQRRPQPRRSA